MTEAGYVGNNVEDMLVDLIMSAKGDIKKAEQGIIYIDEIDKIARTSNGNSEVSREGVQQSLLKIIEGDDIILEINHQKVKINTKNILFIAGGAFEDITMKEHTVKRGIGFNSEEIEAEYSNEIDTKSLVKFGLLPELIGRFPTIVSLNELSVDDLARILVEPKHSIIKQYKDLIKSDNVDITFSKKAINWVANKAYENKTGARGLKSILENNMLDVMFTLPDEKNVKKINVGVKNDKLNIVKKEN
jgi:ATP-dependent Clp protease ATP-binding subunit ClpX